MIFWILAIIVVIWILSKKLRVSPTISEKKDIQLESQKQNITEEVVFKSQARFEKKLEEEIDFPDGIRGVDLYVYRNLMRPWYEKLSSQNRYNEKMTQKIRNDWLDYMSSMEERSTYNYLSLENYNEKDNTKSDFYRDDHILASKKQFAIEDGFASAIGKDAENELTKIRSKSRDWGSFDKFGNLAPEGFKYNLKNELQKKKLNNSLYINL